VGWTLAVDFGTTYTTAACLTNGTTQLLTIGTDTRVPSCVLLLPPDDAANGDRFVAGRAAEHQAALYPGSFEPTPKRVVGQDSILLGD
jgi:molecular chaperone DnaK (HSP70)